MGAPALVPPSPNQPTPAQKALAGQPKTSPLEQAMLNDTEAHHKADARYDTSEQKYSDRLTQLDKADDSMGAPPPMKDIPAPKEQHTSPEKEWGSLAMVMAVIGSAFTRTPLTTAMNSAAAAIKAFHQGDEEQFDHAFKSWQVANENARTAWEYQQKVYESILARHDRERTGALRDKESEDRVTAAQLRAAATSLNDAVMISRLGETERRDASTAVFHAGELQDRRANTGNRIRATDAKITEQGPKIAAWLAVQNSPEYKAAVASHDAKKQLEIIRSSGLMTGYHGAMTEKDQNAAISRLKGSVTGKKWQAADSGWADVQGMAKDPDIYDNFAKQIGLVDKVIFMETGSIRPSLAQYHTMLGAQTADDMVAMALGRLPQHPVLGPDQIRKLITTAKSIHESTDKAWQQYLKSDAATAHLALETKMLPDWQHHDRDSASLKKMVTQDPSNADLRKRQFDEHYGPGAADEALGGGDGSP